MLRRLFSLFLLWTPAVAILSNLACTTRITRYILSTTVSNVLFLLDLFYLSLVASIALVIHTRFIPLQLAQPPAPRITSSVPPSSSPALLLPPPSKLQIEEPQPNSSPKDEDEDQPHSPFSSLSRIPRRSKSQSTTIIPRRPPPPPPSSPSHHTHNCLPQPQPILSTSQKSSSPAPHQHHRVRFTSLPSSIAQDPRSRVVSPLASQLIKTEEAFFPSGSGMERSGGGFGVGNGNGEEEARRRTGGKGKERAREVEEKLMTPPSSPEINLLGELGGDGGLGGGGGGVVGGSGSRRRRRAAVKSNLEEEVIGGDEEKGKDGLGLIGSGSEREEVEAN